MCSYNKVNGSWACENDKLINGILKGELNFQGYMVSAMHEFNTQRLLSVCAR